MRVGDQISEAYLLHANTSKAQARAKSMEMLEAVSIRDAKHILALQIDAVRFDTPWRPNQPPDGPSGKSVTGRAILRLVRPPGMVEADSPTMPNLLGDGLRDVLDPKEGSN